LVIKKEKEKMEKLFAFLIEQATELGNITEAVMYKGGEFSHLKATTRDGKYEVSISISKVKEEEKNEV
jgi:hypothetical protein